MSPADKSPRLGRGLASLLGSATSASPATHAETGGVSELSTNALEPGPYQPRHPIDPETLAELTASITARGVLQPLLVRPAPGMSGRYQIVAGERRWRAAQVAGLPQVPCLIRPLTDLEAAAAALVENLQRQDLNAIEEAEGVARLRDEFGMTQDDLATALGKSRPHISNMLRLLNLPEPVREAVAKGTLSAGHARALLGHPDPEQAMRAVLARGLTVRQTEALAARPDLVEALTGNSESPSTHAKDADTAALERQLMDQLGLRVEIQHGKRGGSMRISYRTLDQLDELVSRLTR